MKWIIVTMSALFLFFGCAKKEENRVKEESLKIVFVTFPTPKDEGGNRVFNALASSNNQIKMSFKVQGNVNYFKVQLGDEVKKNQLIAQLDATPYELRVSQTQFALKEAQASLINAQSNYERTKKLYINQNASASDIDNAKASYSAAKAKVANINKEFEYAQLQLSYTKLYAPQDGYVSLKYVQENENVQAGTPIILLSDKIVDEVSVQVPDAFINKIKKEDSARVIFDAIDENRSFSAKVSEISKFATKESKTYKVIVKLNESSSLIHSGMSANVFFNPNHHEYFERPIYYVPSTSVLNDDKGYFLFILEKKEEYYVIKRQDIQVGKLKNEGFEVLSGVDSSSLILKAGMSEVYENMHVQLGNVNDLDK